MTTATDMSDLSLLSLILEASICMHKTFIGHPTTLNVGKTNSPQCTVAQIVAVFSSKRGIRKPPGVVEVFC